MTSKENSNEPTPSDLECGFAHVPQSGFPALGEWMAEDPDSETFVFRKFERLSARNLLFLQSRVYELEEQSDALDRQLSQADVGLRLSMRKYETWAKKAEDPQSPEAERMRLAESINITLKEYYEALALYSNIVQLSSPRKYQLEAFREWFSGRFSGSGRTFPIVSGKSRTMLDDDDDLVSLRRPPEKDFLTQFTQRYWPQRTTNSGSRTHSATRYFRRRRVSQVVSIVATMTVCLELIGPIVSLYYVRDSDARLGMICGFTTLFGLSLCYLSSAKRGEIFAASAAYAAVLVVFVSGELGQSS